MTPDFFNNVDPYNMDTEIKANGGRAKKITQKLGCISIKLH